MLAYQTVTAEGAAPTRGIVFLHGILGRGSNWRSFAQKVVARRPDYMAMLVDLRLHGASQDVAPPHTLDACASDVIEVVQNSTVPVEAIVGHSFGGKVALLSAHHLRTRHTFLIDSSPSARPDKRGSEDTLQAFDVLKRASRTCATRQAAVDELMRGGLDSQMAQFLAMNYERTDAGFELRLDVESISEMLNDYFTRDLWECVERVSTGGRTCHVAFGGRSNVLSAEDRAEFEEAALREPAGTRLREFPNAGHWIHVDDPKNLLEFVVEGLPRL